MQYTNNLNLKKPDLNDYVNVSDLNDNMDILDNAVSSLQEGSSEIPDLQTTDKKLAGAINEINTKVTAHLDETMPHRFVDNGKTYRWGFRTVNGEPQMIYEEVV